VTNAPIGVAPGGRALVAAQRLDEVAARLERLLAGASGGHAPGLAGQVDAERDALARDCEHLRAECDGLRRALERAEARAARLGEAAGTVDRRLGVALDELGLTIGN